MKENRLKRVLMISTPNHGLVKIIYGLNETKYDFYLTERPVWVKLKHSDNNRSRGEII